MNMKTFVSIICLVIVLIMLSSCSNQPNNPLTPSFQEAISIQGSQSSNAYLWGMWEVILDGDQKSADIVPLRDAQFTCNVTQFLQPPSSKKHLMGVKIDDLQTDWATGHVVVDVSFTHPFPGLNKYTGFDVRGVCIGNGSLSGVKDPGIIYAGPEDLRVLNADGLTRWFNPSEFTTYGSIFGFTLGKLGTPSTNFTATLNGYKYYADQINKDTDIAQFFADTGCPNPRGYFSAGNTITRTYDLQFPAPGGVPKYTFQYAVIASWEPPLVDPPVNIPDDFSVSANCHEAFALSAEDKSDLYFVDNTTKGGTLKLQVRVFDHQGSTNPSGMLAEFSAIHLETSNGLINGNSASFNSTSLQACLVSQDEKSATFNLEVSNVNPFASGEFPVMVIVENANPNSYYSGLSGFAYPVDAKLSAYFIAKVKVSNEFSSEPPVAKAKIVTPPPFCPGDPIMFDAEESYDQDQNGCCIVAYEWDFNGDGTYGDTYDWGTPSQPWKKFNDFSVFQVNVRVTDNEGMKDTLDVPLILNIGAATWVDDDNVSGPWDGSFEKPWPTIQQGINNAQAVCGKKWILVKAGTYQENITMTANTIVEGYSTPAPLIMSPGGSTSVLVNFASVTGSVLKHFKVKPMTTAHAISLTGNGNTVDDIEFINNPGGPTCAFAVQCGTNATVNNVRCNGFSKSTSGFISAIASGVKITNCVLLNITFTTPCPATVLHASNLGPTGLVAKNVIGHITFSQPFVSTQHVSPVIFNNLTGGTIRNNLIFDINNNLDSGWTWGINVSLPGTAKFEHNTISGIKGPAWIYAFETTDHNNPPSMTGHRSHIVTNLTTTGSMQSWRWAFVGYWSTTCYVDYSCTFSVGNSFYNNMAAGAGFLNNVNPQFLNPAGDDYRLASTSPCRNAAHDGTDMGAYGGADPLTWLP